MKLTTLTPPLQALHDSSDDILLVSLISHDGLPVVHIGEGLGHSEEIFIRCREGCICIWPVGDMVFPCMARPSVNSQHMQMLAWKTVSALGGRV